MATQDCAGASTEVPEQKVSIAERPQSKDASSLPESDSSVCSSSKSSLSGSPPASAKQASFISDSDTELTPTKQALKLHSMLKSLKDLKGKTVSEWNGVTGNVVYRGFNVKRFKVDEKYILCPVRGRTVDDILRICDEHPSIVPSWLEFVPKMKRILKVFKGEAHLLSQGVTNVENYFKAKHALQSNMNRLAGDTADPVLDSTLMRQQESRLHKRMRVILDQVKEALDQKIQLRESFFEAYLEEMLKMFAKISNVDISCSKSTVFINFEIGLPSFGTVPQPDFFLTDNFSILAVLEVKRAKNLNFASHKGHRPKSYKDRQNCRPKLGSDADQVCPRKKQKLMAAETDVEECEEQEEPNEALDDTFDAEETQLEEMQKEGLPDHIKHLDITEKRQIRCFMPQLLGQMLACTSVKDCCVQALQHPYLTQILGIGMVGFHVQFVMLALKDLKGEIPSPTAADIEKTKGQSVRPYLYVTRRLNLFNEHHLSIFFRTLFALGTIGQL